jgi:hypothetical protein
MPHCTLSLIELLLKQRDEVSKNMYFVVWYLPIYTCRIGGTGECACEGAEELLFFKSDWQPFFQEAKVLRSEGIHKCPIE